LADSYGLNDIMVDGTTLYCAIIILHGGDNPTTFARIQLIHSPLSTATVSRNDFRPCVLYYSIQTLLCTQAMAPVVRAEPNGCQALLMFDGAYSDLEEFEWLPFIRKFDGYKPSVAQQFVLTFDGCRAKVGDVQLEINEQFLSLATSLPATGQKWSKNCKVEDVPWTLLFQSQMVNTCDKGLPTNMLKQC
jgi:hypothetical protein